MNKAYKYISKFSFIFVAVYAALAVIFVITLPIIEAVPEALGAILLIPFVVLFYSWPFFGPIAIATLIIKLVVYFRRKPAEKKLYVKDMILHSVCSLIGMAGIFIVYYEKFGNPFN